MTDFVYDTFTDANDTQVVDHTGEIGATWLVGFGDLDDYWLIRSNSLARPIYPQPDNHGESLIYPSGSIGATTTIAIEFNLVWDADTDGSFCAIYEQAPEPGNPELLFQISSAVYGSGTQGIYYNGTTTGYVSFTPVVGQTYLVLLEMNNTALTLKLDGVTQATWARTVMPVEPYGIDFYDNAGSGEMRMTSYRIYETGPPPPAAFWQNLVSAAEADS